MSEQLRIPFTDIAYRITGISTPVFCVSWNPPENRREMQGIVGLRQARLRAVYGVDVDPQLASIFPKADDEVAE